jgi:hypothetical protein
METPTTLCFIAHVHVDVVVGLEIRPEASVEVAEAAYKVKLNREHPDTGGSEVLMKQLNQAIDAIRQKSK